jgi:hypothetical protein
MTFGFFAMLGLPDRSHRHTLIRVPIPGAGPTSRDWSTLCCPDHGMDIVLMWQREMLVDLSGGGRGGGSSYCESLNFLSSRFGKQRWMARSMHFLRLHEGGS